MNTSLVTFEGLVALLGIGVLLADLWIPPSGKSWIAYGAAALLGCILVFCVGELAPIQGTAFGGMYIIDPLANFLRPLFLAAAMVVLIMAVEYGKQLGSGLGEFCALTLFATCGMMFAASANDLVLMFVALELITVTFYILNSFQRTKLASVEAGIKYLILGAVASAFLVFGIALVFGATNSTNLDEIFLRQREVANSPLFLVGVLMVLIGLGFKTAAFPFQFWAPDVYQGAPVPAVAFLATGSKAAGIALLLRVLFSAVPAVAAAWSGILAGLAAGSIVYGSLCAIPQRSVKRLLGYSSIANAGYLLLGVAAGSKAGAAATLYYLVAYTFSVLAAFTVISVVLEINDNDDLTTFAGLGQRSPLLAAVLTLAMASLAGVPPLAGFFGKFVLFRAVISGAATDSKLYWLAGVGLVGVVISLYYYFGIVRVMYWGRNAVELPPPRVDLAGKFALGVCVAGMLFFGVVPGPPWKLAVAAAEVLRPEATVVAQRIVP